MRWMVLIVVAAALAGCAKSDAPEIDVQATPDTGVIRGIVLDTTITPVANANVTIEGFVTQATTNADGAFGFDGLPQGTYLLHVTAQGYLPASASVDVIAAVDEPDFVQISVQPEQAKVPYAQPFQWDGFLQCSYRIVQVADNCPEGDAEITHEIASIPQWVQSELSWESTQYLGDELSFQYSIPNTNKDYVEQEGPTPLTLIADPTVIDKEGLGDGLDLYLRVFTADLQETRPPTGHWGIGLQIDQGFTSFTHVFFEFQPEAGWTFLTDGDPQ